MAGRGRSTGDGALLLSVLLVVLVVVVVLLLVLLLVLLVLFLLFDLMQTRWKGVYLKVGALPGDGAFYEGLTRVGE